MNPDFNMADWIVPLLLDATIAATVLALALLALSPWLRQWIPARWMYVLWLLVALRLVLVVCPASSLSVLNWVPHGATQEVRGVVPLVTEASLSPFEFVTGDEFRANQPVCTDPPHTPSGLATWTWFDGFCLVWFLVVSVLLLRLGIQAVAASRILQRSPAIHEKKVLRLFDSCKQELELHQSIGLVQTDLLPMPAIIGIVRPTVVLPRWCLREMNCAQLRLILLHELVHFRNRDVIIHLAATLIRTIHWFNPFAVVMHRKICQLREICCDQAVLKRCGHSSNQRLYAATVIQVAERCSMLQSNHAWMRGLIGTSPVPLNRNLLFERIQIMNRKTENQGQAGRVLTLAVSALLVLVTFTSAQDGQTGVRNAPESEATPQQTFNHPIPLPSLLTPNSADAGSTAEANDASTPVFSSLAYHLTILEGNTATMNDFLDRFAVPRDDEKQRRFDDQPSKGGFTVALKDQAQPQTGEYCQENDINVLIAPTLAVSNLGRSARLTLGGEVPYSVVEQNLQGKLVQKVEMRPLGFQLELISQETDEQLLHFLTVTDSHLDGSYQALLPTDAGNVLVEQPNISTRKTQTVMVGSFDAAVAYCYTTRTATELHTDKAEWVDRIILIRAARIDSANLNQASAGETDTRRK